MEFEPIQISTKARKGSFDPIVIIQQASAQGQQGLGLFRRTTFSRNILGPSTKNVSPKVNGQFEFQRQPNLAPVSKLSAL